MVERGTLLEWKSYDYFYYFLLDFPQFLIERGLIIEKPKIFYTYIEILTEDREYEEYYLFRKERKYEIDMSSRESFVKSIIIPIDSRYSDEEIVVENLVAFSYTHNLGYSRVSKMDPHTGNYRKQVVYDGFPTKVLFKAFLENKEDKVIFLNGLEIPMQELKKITEKHNGEIVFDHIKY